MVSCFCFNRDILLISALNEIENVTLLTIFKKEVSSYFNSLTGYLVIAIFLLITGLVVWVFPTTSVLEAGYTTLESFFGIAPYLFMFLIPAVTMRTIAGEKSDGTYELLMSRPRTATQIVLGKFLGGFVIALLSILLTIGYAISLSYLGNPIGNIDVGATWGSYLGLMMLAAAFVAIGLFCSSLMANPIVSFLLAVFLCFIFYYGFDAISTLPIFVSFEDSVAALGIQHHYRSISRGVLLSEDFIYFISLTGLALVGTSLRLRARFLRRRDTARKVIGTLLVLTLLNTPFISSSFGQIDFTEDKRFTLDPSAIAIVENLQEDVYITIFLDGNDLPAGFKRLKKAAVDMVNDLRRHSKRRLHLNIINPHEGDEQERQELTQALIERGLYPTNLSIRSDDGYKQTHIFPWAIVGSERHEIPVNLLQSRMGTAPEEALNNSVQNLEYALTNAIHKTDQNEAPFIGFTEGHGEPSDLELYDAMQTLLLSNQVGRISLADATYESLRQLKVMVIAKPQTAFSEGDKYKIDYFVRHGGHVIWAIDQLDVGLEHLREHGSQPLVGKTLNIDDMLFVYGTRLNYDLLADLNCAQIPLTVGNIGGQPQIELVPWFFFPIIMPMSSHPIVKNLDGIRMEFIGTVDTMETTGIKKEILLSSSPFTRLLTPPYEISLQMVEEQPDPTTFRTQPAPVAVLMQGKFPYVFANRPAPEGISESVDLTSVSNESKMVVVSDGDWLINQVNTTDQSPYPLGWDRYMNQQFGNKLFLENLVDYLLRDESLIQLRNREVKLRLLDTQKVRTEKLYWQLMNVVLPIVLLTIFGILHQYIRRRRYAKAII